MDQVGVFYLHLKNGGTLSILNQGHGVETLIALLQSRAMQDDCYLVATRHELQGVTYVRLKRMEGMYQA